MRNTDKKICLNPKCPAPSVRIFCQNQQNQHKYCTHWIIDSDIHSKIQQHVKQKIPLSCELSISIQQFGILSVAQILQLRQWPKQIHTIFQDMKQRVLQQIDIIKNRKVKQFENLYQSAELAYAQMQCCLQMLTIQDNNPLILQKNILNLSNFEKFKALSMYQNFKIQHYFDKTFLPSLQKIGNLIQSFQLTPNQAFLKNRREAVYKTNEYFYDNSILINDKIQKLTYLFGKEMVKTVYDSQLATFRTNCWICDAICLSSKEQPTKLGCLQQLLLHSINYHCREVCLTYMNKVLRIDVQQVKYKSFIDSLSFSQVNQIVVIDRENAGTIDRPLELKQGSVWIEILNKQNRKLAKGQYIIAQSTQKDAADILISIFIYELAKNGVNKIVLVTKDHFGITLKQLLSNMFPNKIDCIQPRDFIQSFNGDMKNSMNDL